jgi:hypothetical protein
LKVSSLKFLLLLAVGTPIIAPIQAVKAEGNQNLSNVITGTLTNKGENFIEVQVDGYNEPTRFRVSWIGGMPNAGGGPDKKVMAQISKLAVPSRVRVKWASLEGPRVLAVEMIDRPTEKPKNPENPKGPEIPKGPENPNYQTGVATGNLMAKGDGYIDVKVDGRNDVTRFRAQWIGGRDGSFDKKVLTQIGKLVVPSRVQLKWAINEGPRVLAVEMIDRPTENPKPPAASGQAKGIVVAKGENWIEIRTENETRRFTPRWIGGMPNAGGGLDKQMLYLISQAPIGAKVKYEWTYDERLRIVALAPVQ